MTLRIKLIALAVSAALFLSSVGAIYWSGRHAQAEKDRPQIERSLDQATVSDLTAIGERESSRRVEVVVRQARDTFEMTSTIANEAYQAEDAYAPIDPDRAARMQRSDRELCAARPSLVGCEPAPGDADAR